MIILFTITENSSDNTFINQITFFFIFIHRMHKLITVTFISQPIAHAFCQRPKFRFAKILSRDVSVACASPGVSRCTGGKRGNIGWDALCLFTTLVLFGMRWNFVASMGYWTLDCRKCNLNLLFGLFDNWVFDWVIVERWIKSILLNLGGMVGNNIEKLFSSQYQTER